MTSTTGTDAHPEVDEISALSEGLLTSARAAEVRDHLAGCDLCADVLASLEEIRRLLGSLPGPHQMPDDVAGRIDAALAAEARSAASHIDVPRETSAHRETHGDVPRGTSTVPHSRTAPDSRTAPTGQAGRADVPTGPVGRAGAPTGPGRQAGGNTRTAGFRRRGRTLLATVSAVAALTLGGIVYAAVNSGDGASEGSSSVTSSSGSGVSAEVGTQVRHLLGGTANRRVDTPMLSNGTNDSPFSPENAPGVPPCVLKAIHGTHQPLAAEREPFQGKDAYLLVLPHPGDNRKVDAFVVNASCSSTGPGTVLFQATYTR